MDILSETLIAGLRCKRNENEKRLNARKERTAFVGSGICDLLTPHNI